LEVSYNSQYTQHIEAYESFFVVHRRDVSPQAFSYLNGLLMCERGKKNMERMEEVMPDIEYHQYQHFISNSPWDYKGATAKVRSDANEVMRHEREKQNCPTGLIIDESAHLKRGDKSVGVARQYAGVVGKVENCQVGVYASLCTGNRSCLIDERLYLPESWTSDPQRCEEAGIPQESCTFKTKPQLALDIIDQAKGEEIEFNWVGGDGLYGHTYELRKGLDERGLLFVLDIHKDTHVFLSEPAIFLPERQGDVGRMPTIWKTEDNNIRVDKYASGISKDEWQKVRIRKTAKGWLKAWVHIKTVWVWNGEEPTARKSTLVIRKSIGSKPEIKYSLSNGSIEKHTIEEFAYFQAQRYWVERDFQNCKSELGMSDYQVRKWLGWHHHHTSLFMALLLMLQEKIEHEIDYPLMSVRDARILVTVCIAKTILKDDLDMVKQLQLMRKRHDKRKSDIDRHYLDDG